MRSLLNRLLHAFTRRQFEDDLTEELAFHRALKAQELEDRGQLPHEAAFAARRALGSQALALDRARDVWTWRWLEDLGGDARYAARTLRRSPGFTGVAILTVALGIGANAAIFSLLNAVLLRSLPVRDPQQLLFFGRTAATGSTGFVPNGRTELFSYSFFRDFRRENQVFAEVAAVGSIPSTTNARVAGARRLEPVAVELVSGTYFSTLGVGAIAGRTLTEADDQVAGGHPVAVASYAWSRRRFDQAPSAIGTTVSIGTRTYQVIGVAQAGFSGMTLDTSPDFWIPLAMQRDISPAWNGREQPMFQTLHLVGRLKPGVSRAQAQAATNLLFRQVLRTYLGAAPAERTLDNLQRAYIDLTPATTGRSPLRAQFSSPLKILMAVVGVVLLIACANVANLLLARAGARQREIAVRMSLGAGRLRLVRQLLAESLLLASAGATLGLVFASVASRLLVSLVSTGTQPLPLAVTPDLTVLAFTVVATLVTLLLFGCAPAIHATRINLTPSLKEGGSASAGRGRARLSRSLIVGQIALSLALLAGAILFLRSLINVMSIDTGFDKRNVLVAGVDPGASGYRVDARLAAMMTRVEERVGRVPGVQGASFAFFVFNHGGWSTDDILVPGREQSAADPSVDLNLVGPQYLDVMRMPILAGRGLDARDTERAPRVAVINQTMARLYFGEPFPLGRTFTIHDDEKSEVEQWANLQVVGVVKDANYRDVQEKQMAAAFLPHAQHRRYFLYNLVVRHEGNAALVLPAVRRAVAEIDPDLPLGDVTTLGRLVEDNVVDRRAIAQLSAFFGALAVLLACIGIYGVTSYGITRRTNEFGIRLALGAPRTHVLYLVLGETARLGVAGAGLGLILAMVAGRYVSSLLFGLTPYDPAAIGTAAAAIISVALLAGYLPARRATRIDPITALRRD